MWLQRRASFCAKKELYRVNFLSRIDDAFRFYAEKDIMIKPAHLLWLLNDIGTLAVALWACLVIFLFSCRRDKKHFDSQDIEFLGLFWYVHDSYNYFSYAAIFSLWKSLTLYYTGYALFPRRSLGLLTPLHWHERRGHARHVISLFSEARAEQRQLPRDAISAVMRQAIRRGAQDGPMRFSCRWLGPPFIFSPLRGRRADYFELFEGVWAARAGAPRHDDVRDRHNFAFRAMGFMMRGLLILERHIAKRQTGRG